MFNSPRQSGQRYNSNGFVGADQNPLAASSVYDNFDDPWSNTPSPGPPSPVIPPATGAASGSRHHVIADDATVPSIYHTAYASVAETLDGNGEMSVQTLTRVLRGSRLPASQIDRIVNLVSSRPRVSKLEFFVALALVGLAQQGNELDVQQVAALSQQNELPEPTIDLSPQATSSVFTTGTQDSPAPAYSSLSNNDPWNSRFGHPPAVETPTDPFGPAPSLPTPGASAISGTGLPPNWWKHQEIAQVVRVGQQGFILTRYTVYQVVTSKGSVTRRYSEFAFLWDCLAKRYPFRLFPALPPKRIGPDEYFLEQRRRGLIRSLSFIINHPVLNQDALLQTFLTVPSFEQWRKQATVSLEEESASKKVDKVEEMSIPGDLEDRLVVVKNKLPQLIEHFQRVCLLAERIIKRREAASSDLARLTNTFLSLTELNSPTYPGGQCAIRGEGCELDLGVRDGLEGLANHLGRASELAEIRVRGSLDTTLEGLKRQRDLYLALRDLFGRHAKFSPDQVDKLKKRIEANQAKIESTKKAGKDGWEEVVEGLMTSIERDGIAIQAALRRRVFIRACIWSELRIILHNHSTTLLSVLTQSFATSEREYTENVTANWRALEEAVAGMPIE